MGEKNFWLGLHLSILAPTKDGHSYCYTGRTRSMAYASAQWNHVRDSLKLKLRINSRKNMAIALLGWNHFGRVHRNSFQSISLETNVQFSLTFLCLRLLRNMQRLFAPNKPIFRMSDWHLCQWESEYRRKCDIIEKYSGKTCFLYFSARGIWPMLLKCEGA